MEVLLVPATEKFFRWEKRGVLGRGITASGETSWHNLEGMSPVTFTIEGTFVGTVTLYVSNSENIDLTTGTDYAPLAVFTKPDSRAFDLPYGCVKAVIALTSGTIRSISYYARDRGAQN